MTTFIVSISKQSSGLGYAYTIDAVRTPRLTLIVGKTYKFKVKSKDHPFIITTDPIGGNRNMKGALEEVHKDDKEGILNGIIEFRPTANHIGKSLYYQCNWHISMGHKIKVVSN